MVRVLIASAAAALIFGIASEGGSARPATKQPTVAGQLQAYLRQTQKPVNRLAFDDQRVDSANFIYGQLGESTMVVSPLDAATRDMTTVPTLLAAVKPPLAMRGPHALLVAAAKRFRAKLTSADAKADAADLSQQYSLTSAVGDAAIAQALMHDVEANWRQELVVQLRRARVTVPLWVKHVGA